MKLIGTICSIAALLLIATSASAVSFNAFGVHGGTISVSGDQITAVTGNTAGQNPEYHWNKSNWDTRTGQKVFYGTSDFNGMPVSSITSMSWTVTSGYWGNAYFNVMVEDANGKKAILAPGHNSATTPGWDTDASDDGAQKPFCVFEAEAGWSGTSATGWYAANWDEIKNLTITDGPFTEFPDTLTGTALSQNDSVYGMDNWAAWADQTAGSDLNWEKAGVMISFGQSTGPATNPAMTVIDNVSIVPEPASLAILALGLVVTITRRR